VNIHRRKPFVFSPSKSIPLINSYLLIFEQKGSLLHCFNGVYGGNTITDANKIAKMRFFGTPLILPHFGMIFECFCIYSSQMLTPTMNLCAMILTTKMNDVKMKL